jgi:hypothetical protein
MTLEPRHEDSASVTILQKLNDGIRENPVGAALVGLGIVWMLAGTSGMAAAVRAPAAAARGVPRRAHRAAEAMGEGAAHVASAVRHVAGSAAGVVGDATRATVGPIGRTAESTASAVGEGVSRIGSAMADSARQVGSAAQGALQRATGDQSDAPCAEEQTHSVQEAATHTVGRMHREFGAQLQAHPLLIGGIGLAIGAGLAALFPRTAIEARVMGEAADDMRARVGEMTGVAAAKVEDTVREIGAEAREIGVAARAAAEDVAQKATSAAGRDVITSRVG